MTFDIDLQNTFTETYYQLYFPDWTSPSVDTTTLSGYMGFNEPIYSPSVTSNQQYITTQTINTETTADYVIDGSNNFFTIEVYSNDDYTYNIDTTPLLSFNVLLQTETGATLTSSRATRSTIIDSLQRGIQNNIYLKFSR